jgi:hypothetical protein
MQLNISNDCAHVVDELHLKANYSREPESRYRLKQSMTRFYLSPGRTLNYQSLSSGNQSVKIEIIM